MRRLIFIPLLFLVACSLPNMADLKSGFGGKTTKPTAEQPSTAINTGVIQTQTLAPLGQTVAPLTAAKPNTSPALPKATPIPSSPEEVACRAKGGQWGKAGKLAAMTCYVPSKDAGKSCSRQSDCTSQCLARSRTCAPIWPIFGCSDVLQNDGSLVKLCID
jgi:hypothetical protein